VVAGRGSPAGQDCDYVVLSVEAEQAVSSRSGHDIFLAPGLVDAEWKM